MARDMCVGARSLVRLPEVGARWVRSLHLIQEVNRYRLGQSPNIAAHAVEWRRVLLAG